MKKIFSIIALSVIMLCAANAANAKKACTKSDNATAIETIIANTITNNNFNTEMAEPAAPPKSVYFQVSFGCLTITYDESDDCGYLFIEGCGFFIGIYTHSPAPKN